jgi:signal transduction histidine kinase
VEVEPLGDLAGGWDADRLAQVLSNLLANAAIHGKKDGVVRLRLDGTAADSVQFEVWNAGQIPDDRMADLFEPFRGSAERRGARGLGLGLYITREIVRSHGGSIDVRSDEDGTSFRTRLPRVALRQTG